MRYAARSLVDVWYSCCVVCEFSILCSLAIAMFEGWKGINIASGCIVWRSMDVGYIHYHDIVVLVCCVRISWAEEVSKFVYVPWRVMKNNLNGVSLRMSVCRHWFDAWFDRRALIMLYCILWDLCTAQIECNSGSSACVCRCLFGWLLADFSQILYHRSRRSISVRHGFKLEMAR